MGEFHKKFFDKRDGHMIRMLVSNGDIIEIGKFLYIKNVCFIRKVSGVEKDCFSLIFDKETGVDVFGYFHTVIVTENRSGCGTVWFIHG